MTTFSPGDSGAGFVISPVPQKEESKFIGPAPTRILSSKTSRALSLMGRLKYAVWWSSKPRVPRFCVRVTRSRTSSEKNTWDRSSLTADGDQIHDIRSRIVQALTRCGSLRHVLDVQQLSVGLKLCLYKAAVCSILTYGCETWRLTPTVMRKINGTNSKMLTRFTGKTIPQEARATSSTFNLVKHIRVRRLKWIGHILRAGPDRLIYQAVEEQRRLGLPGNLLMDAPPHNSLTELAIQAKDRAAWGAFTHNIQ